MIFQDARRALENCFEITKGRTMVRPFLRRGGTAILAPATYEVGQLAEFELGGGLKTHSDWRGRVKVKSFKLIPAFPIT